MHILSEHKVVTSKTYFVGCEVSTWLCCSVGGARPRPTQPSILPGSLNEDQLRPRRKRQVPDLLTICVNNLPTVIAWSAMIRSLSITHPCDVTYGSRAFAVSGPTRWNLLPSSLKSPSLKPAHFLKQLKTVLMAQPSYLCYKIRAEIKTVH